MKYFIIILSFILCLELDVFCQASTDTLSLKDLEIPNSPAFILLDQSPTTIERPSSSKAFVLNVLNSFQENNGFPQNYAVDLTPFWFFKHPNMTSLKYAGYNAKKQKQMIFGNLARTSVSFAFVTTMDSAIQKSVNNLSLGIRFNLITIRSAKDISDLKRANSELINLLEKIDKSLEEYIHDPTLIWIDPTLYHVKVKNFYEQNEVIEMMKVNEENTIKNILDRKPVFGVDGAVGYNNFFVDNDYSDVHFGRSGVWLTLNYSRLLDKKNSEKNYVNFYALGRYLSDGTTLTNGIYTKQNYYDFGGKIELEFKKISISYEYIYRINDITNTFRSNGLMKYKISDKVFLTTAFGKNFGTSNNLISLFGLNWGLSTNSEKVTVKDDN